MECGNAALHGSITPFLQAARESQITMGRDEACGAFNAARGSVPSEALTVFPSQWFILARCFVVDTCMDFLHHSARSKSHATQP